MAEKGENNNEQVTTGEKQGYDEARDGTAGVISRITHLLVLFTMGWTLVFVFKEFLLKWRIPGTVILMSDVVDLAILTPFSALMFFLVYSELTGSENYRHRQDKGERHIHMLAVVFLAIFFLGTGVHFTGNSVHQLLMEKEAIQDTELSDLVYFYDEILGHWLMISGLFGLLATAIILQYNRPSTKQMESTEFRVLTLAGLIFGCGLGWVAVQGHFKLAGLGFFFTVLFCVHRVFRNEFPAIRRFPLILYIASGSLAGTVSILLWSVF